MTELEGKRTSYSTVVAVKQGAAQRMRGWLLAKPVDVPEAAGLGEGWVAMRMDFENRDQARFMVLGLGVRARVLAPAELRLAVAEEINGMLAQMGNEAEISQP